LQDEKFDWNLGAEVHLMRSLAQINFEKLAQKMNCVMLTGFPRSWKIIENPGKINCPGKSWKIDKNLKVMEKFKNR